MRRSMREQEKLSAWKKLAQLLKISWLAEVPLHADSAESGNNIFYLLPIPKGRRGHQHIPANLISQTLAVPQPLPWTLPNKMQDFQNFVLHNCILDFDAEQVKHLKLKYLKLQVLKAPSYQCQQVYLKLQVAKVKNNELNSKT